MRKKKDVHTFKTVLLDLFPFKYASKNEFSTDELEKINKKLTHSLDAWSEFDNIYETMMLGEKRPSLLNGYKVPSIEKINNMVLYFAEKVKPFFPNEHTHTSKEGAALNAQSIVKGIKEIKKCKLKKYLL